MNHQPATTVERDPARPAVITSDGVTVSYVELEAASRRLALDLADRGLGPADNVAVLVGNDHRAHEILWAVNRSGFVFTPISPSLTPAEAAFIVADCGAKAVIANHHGATLATEVSSLVDRVEHVMILGRGAPPPLPMPDRLGTEQEGAAMTYSSGTTGRPKGVRRTIPNAPLGSSNPLEMYFDRMGVRDESVFIVPAPVYHAAPLFWSMALHRVGATCVLMDGFDAGVCLDLMRRHRVTHGLFVPTMFVRLLKLPPEERAAFDPGHLEAVIHAAAPCPTEVKRRMIEWWGPVIHEFYAASEGGGATYITADEWLAHPGSVGKPFVGTPHICGDMGEELPVGEIGVVWFEGVGTIEYHNNPESSAKAVDDRGWVTLWDVGRLDDDGYLYLTDRKQFMIVSGGVNIYPQEVEDVLVLHPAVRDCAVFGVPNDEFGEEVKAVVELVDGKAEVEEVSLAQELIDFCRASLAHYKAPRSVDFAASLPRADTGKLYKRELRERYWEGRGESRIV